MLLSNFWVPFCLLCSSHNFCLAKVGGQYAQHNKRQGQNKRSLRILMLWVVPYGTTMQSIILPTTFVPKVVGGRAESQT